MSETLMRQWQMLRLIPRHPRKISTAELKLALDERGFEIHQRSIQRDLMALSNIFPLTCDERNKPFGWSWMDNADVMDIPGMDSHTALTFYFVKENLEHLLPVSTSKLLQPHFKTAQHVLDTLVTNKDIPKWTEKVRVISRGPKLKAPSISNDVQIQVYDALLHNRKLELTYRNREGYQQGYQINPLGLVFKDGIFYLVCSFKEHDNIRQLAMHRILKAKELNASCDIPVDFNLDEYIDSGEFGIPSGGEIKIKALFSEDAALHLGERPLCNDQNFTRQNDGRILITATVQNTSELRWWFLGFGDSVEIFEPEALRAEFADISYKMNDHYNC